MNGRQGGSGFFGAAGEAVTVTSSPPGLQSVADGFTYTAPQTFNWMFGSTHSIGTSSPQAGTTGTQYALANWSDSGAKTHNITVPAMSITYTASFNTQYLLTTSVTPANSGSVSVSPTCSGACFYNSGTVVSLTATPASNFVFSAWSGGLTGN